MDWESQLPFDGKVVWWSRFDGRYQIEVHQKSNYVGDLAIFDHGDDNKLIHNQEVHLDYGAKFGPDIANVNEWKQIAVEAVDGRSTSEE